MRQKSIVIHKDATIKEALKKLDVTADKVLLVIDDQNILLGTLSDGDIRRYILNGKSMDNNISEVYNKKPCSVSQADFDLEKVKAVMLAKRIELIPIVDAKNKVVDFITWDQAFADHPKEKLSASHKIDVPVVIMAGGKGTRLEPFTTVFPKPLIPIGEKTIIEIIIESFQKSGINKFYLTLNYKGKMIEAYFNSIENKYDVEFVWEKEFFGTAGGLRLLKDKIHKTFIVSNCDILVDARYKDVLDFHKDNKAALTILSSIQHHKIPYGVVTFHNGGVVDEIVEKPEYTVTINAGVYILSKECLDYIPTNQRFDMPDLIRALIKANKKILTYPVNESNYIDIGQWAEYKNAVEKLKL